MSPGGRGVVRQEAGSPLQCPTIAMTPLPQISAERGRSSRGGSDAGREGIQRGISSSGAGCLLGNEPASRCRSDRWRLGQLLDVRRGELGDGVAEARGDQTLARLILPAPLWAIILRARPTDRTRPGRVRRKSTDPRPGSWAAEVLLAPGQSFFIPRQT